MHAFFMSFPELLAYFRLKDFSCSPFEQILTEFYALWYFETRKMLTTV